MPDFQIALIQVTPFQQNCSLVWDTETKQAAVIDPGGDAERILAGIAQLELKVEKILLTHGHLDHAGGAKTVRDALDVEITGPDRRDLFLLQGIEEQGKKFNIPGLQNVTPDHWLAEGDVVEVGRMRFDVLHCPGHTPGHIVFVEATHRFGFFGDTLFRGAVGRTDFPYGDTQALLGAIKTKLLPLGDDLSFVCGHGPSSTIGAERASNPFLRR